MKKSLVFVLALVMIFAFTVTALAAPAPKVEPTEVVWTDGFGFHCNALNGNGQTSVEYVGGVAAVNDSIAKIKKQPAGSLVVLKGDQKDIFGTKTYPITIVKVDGTTMWNLITGTDIVCETCGRTDWVTYSNNSGVPNGKNIQAHHPPTPPPTFPDVFYGTADLAKTVDGIAIQLWLDKNFDGDVNALLAGIEFKAYKVAFEGDTNYTEDDLFAVGELDLSGNIAFVTIDNYTGWVVVVETLTGLAAEVFEQVDPQYFYFNGETFGGTGGGFDFDALYELKSFGGRYVLGDGSLNASGNIQDLFVRAIGTDDWLSAFCANAGSTALGTHGYTAQANNALADPVALAKAVAALNYIYNKYGSVDQNNGWGYANGSENQWAAYAAAIAAYNNGDEADYIALMSNHTRLLSQIAVWAFFNGHDFTDGQIRYYPANGNLPWEYQIAIDDLIENGLTGEGDLKLAYLVCATHGLEHIIGCQPQLVPYFPGEVTFDNKPRDDEEFFGGVQFNKTKYQGLFPVDADEFAFDLFKKVNGEWVLVTAADYDPDAFETPSRFYTDLAGQVTVFGLTPGEYKFVEVWAVVFAGGLGFDDDGNPVENYNLVWKANYPNGDDALYFTIKANGDAEWKAGYALDEQGCPTVDNEIYGKHTVLWAPDGYDPVALTLPHVQVIELGEGNGKIIILSESGATMEIVEIRYPTCQDRGIVHLGCSDGTGASIAFGELCDHDYVYLALVADGEHDGWVWFGGQNGCVCGGMMYNYEAWLALGGPELEQEMGILED